MADVRDRTKRREASGGYAVTDESSTQGEAMIYRRYHYRPRALQHLPAFAEPENCPQCGARRQYNLDYEVIHARAGTIECPPARFSEDPVMALIQRARSVTA